MIKHLKELIQFLKEYTEWYNANYGPTTQESGGGPGSNPPTPPPPPPGGKG
jgi:hypothetical protein